MRKNDDIRIGDRVDLYLNQPPYYRTVVDDILSDGALVVQIPTHRGLTVILRKEQELRIFYYRHNGRFSLDARVRKLNLGGNIRTVELERLSDCRKEQRRLAFRVPVNIRTNVCFPPEVDGGLDLSDMDQFAGGEREEVYTKDISETGLAIYLQKHCEPGMKVVLEVYLPFLPEWEQPMKVFAVIRQTRFDEVRKRYKAGLEFLEMTEKMRMMLSKYLLMQQQQLLKQQRLVEEE
jgi:c-di-GMP-binding flagellar brake protein YcgR